MFINKCGSAEHAFLFAVGEQEDDVVVERRACPQSVHGFEQRRHSSAIVARARPGGYGIVMRGEHEGVRAAAGALEPSDDVFDQAGHLIDGRDTGRALDLGGQAEIPNLADQIIPHAIVFRRTDRMRSLREVVQVC